MFTEGNERRVLLNENVSPSARCASEHRARGRMILARDDLYQLHVKRKTQQNENISEWT